MRSPGAQNSGAVLRVWDPLVRLFHWSLVAGMAAAWLTSSIRSDTHQWIGLGVAGLIGGRLVWGFVGPRYARFASFIKSPFSILRYIADIILGTEQRYLGHNPAGGAMVVVLILAVLGTALTGWLMTTDAWYGDDIMQITHSIFAYGTVILIVSHICGVILASYRHKENLVKAMVTGEKKAPEAGDVT